MHNEAAHTTDRVTSGWSSMSSPKFPESSKPKTPRSSTGTFVSRKVALLSKPTSACPGIGRDGIRGVPGAYALRHYGGESLVRDSRTMFGLSRAMGPDWKALPRYGLPRADGLAAHALVPEVGIGYADPRSNTSQRSSPIPPGVQRGDLRVGHYTLPVERPGGVCVHPATHGHCHQAWRVLPGVREARG